MGTDINVYAEARTPEGWAQVHCQSDGDPTERRYALFAVLAGVRNGSGFAGVKTHLPVAPWFPGRGLPSDTSYVENWEDPDATDLGDYGFTHASLRELVEAPWATTQIVWPHQTLSAEEIAGGFLVWVRDLARTHDVDKTRVLIGFD